MVSFDRLSLFAVAIAVLLAPCYAQTEDSLWIPIFNGKDIADWTPKFMGHPVGTNPANTFQFKAGPPPVLSVVHSASFSQTGYGHLFYKKRTFSFYIIRAEYDWIGEGSASGFQPWTTQNNGLMLHSQSAESMAVGKDFPNSLEAQLLGPRSGLSPGTMNLCTPGTVFKEMNGQTNNNHCVNSSSVAADRTPQWVTVSARVLGDSLIEFFVGSKRVYQFQKPTLDNGTALKEGYVTIQAEGTSVDFRKIDVLDLVGCMTRGQPGYRSYFVRHDASKCAVTPTLEKALPKGFGLGHKGLNLFASAPEKFQLDVIDARGKLVRSLRGEPGTREVSVERAGVYSVRVKWAGGTHVRNIALF